MSFLTPLWQEMWSLRVLMLNTARVLYPSQVHTRSFLAEKGRSDSLLPPHDRSLGSGENLNSRLGFSSIPPRPLFLQVGVVVPVSM